MENKESKENNIYLQKVIEKIEKMRQFSIKNAKHTDLYTIEQLHEFMSWYTEIIQLIKNSPPIDNVKVLHIKESPEGKVTEIEYQYYTREESQTEQYNIEFVIE